MYQTPKLDTLALAGGGLFSLWLLGGCSNPTICVALTNIPAGTAQLQVSTAIKVGSDQISMVGMDQHVAGNQTRLCVELPASATESVSIDIEALDSGGCKLASTSVSDNVPKDWPHHYYYAKSFVSSGTVSSDGWCRLEFRKDTVPNLSLVQGIAGSSAQDVWMLDSLGILLNWNGQSWSVVSQVAPWGVKSMWGSPGKELWTVSAEEKVGHFVDGSWRSYSVSGQLRDIWGSGPSDLWSVGEPGDMWQILRSSGGGEWTSIAGPSGTPKPLYQVWGRGPDDIWMVGAELTILHADQSGNVVSSPTSAGDSTADLYGVWASGRDDVWAVGAGGVILHKVGGNAWDLNYKEAVHLLHSVWGSSRTNVWAVGENGTILHWDGTAWKSVVSGTSETLYRVWGTETGEVWAVGGRGTILHHAGGSS